MNKQYRMISFSLFVLVMLVMSSCYEEPDFVGDNSTTEGKHYPVIAAFSVVDELDGYEQGSTVTVDLDFWSEDDIKEINFRYVYDAEDVLAGTSPYVANFQVDSQTDDLVMGFTVPVVSDTTTVTIDAEVVNANGLAIYSKDGGTGNRPSVSIVVYP